MPSPPPASSDSPIDLNHLRGMTMGDPALEQEVLALFAAQTADLLRSLAAMPDDAAARVHTLKGSARAIGAFRVADAAAGLEAAMRAAGDASEALARLQREVTLAQQAVAEMLRHSEG